MRKLFVFILFIQYVGHSQIKDYYSNGVLKSSADTLNGKLNGNYILYNESGKTLMKGRFKDNLKIGNWIFADSLGNVNLKRKYTNTYQYTDNYKGKTTKRKQYTMERDSLGLLEYTFVNDNSVSFYARFCRYIPFDKNQKLSLLKDALLNYSTTPEAEVYKTELFENKILHEQIVSLIHQNKSNIEGFKISEVWFIDKNSRAITARIMGICPVIKVNNELKNLFWIYYTAARSTLTDSTATTNEKIEDMLQLRNFNSIVYFRENVKEKDESKTLLNISPGTLKESAAYELMILYWEWLQLEEMISKNI